MRSTRHGSVCTQSVGPRDSRSRWSVVVARRWDLRCPYVRPLSFNWRPLPRYRAVASPYLSLDLRHFITISCARMHLVAGLVVTRMTDHTEELLWIPHRPYSATRSLE